MQVQLVEGYRSSKCINIQKCRSNWVDNKECDNRGLGLDGIRTELVIDMVE